jgi:nucleotide-binding universal stress UspA family protein
MWARPEMEASHVKRVIAAVDGSEASIKAATTAEALARSMGATLDLVFVREAPPDPEVGWSQEPDGYKPYGEEVLKSVARRLVAPEAVSLLNLQGRAAEVVADVAEAKEVDLVVVGSRGRNQVAKALVGSVADRLVHICSKPVLVVR